MASDSLVIDSGVTSGLAITIHPLPILNISDHHTRTRLTSPSPPKLIGALLGTQTNREISIVNSFELTFAGDDGDVDMAGTGLTVNSEFVETRKDQFKQVFPTLDIVGWYSIGHEPTKDDIILHQQFTGMMDNPILLLFDPSPVSASQDLPISVYESALESTGENIRLVELGYGIETGEAERIAVDGVSRGGMGDGGVESSVIGNLTTQRNAIRMLYERIQVLLEYVAAVIAHTAIPDPVVLRQISALTATLPTMDAAAFKTELTTEYSDVQLASYLAILTKQLDSLSDYSDKHNTAYPAGGTDDRVQRSFPPIDWRR